MPHFPHTPERLLGRNDSKNPSTTCKGITASGRPCRRALASPRPSPTGGRKFNAAALNGVVAIVQEDGAIQEADFYCWQHKDQAEQRVENEKRNTADGKSAKRRPTELFLLREQSSIDTLVQRLGIDAATENGANELRKGDAIPKPPRKTHTNDFATPRRTQAPYAEKYNFLPPARSKPKKQGFWASLCCMGGGDDEYVEIVRHRKRVEQAQAPEMSTANPTEGRRPSPLWTSQTTTAGLQSAPVSARRPVAKPTSQSAHPTRTLSSPQTTQYLSLIPQRLSPQATSTLLAELVKPISPYDEEGYIYIFWLTPQSINTPTESTARSLLAPPNARPQYDRRVSDIMTEYSYDGTFDADDARPGARAGKDRGGSKTIMLKIGRANNVTRRMNEWQRQCGYALNLVRWYPYIPSSGTPSPGPSPSRQSPPLYPDLSKPATPRRESDVVRKVPYVKRVERLIHLELASRQVKRHCNACGKAHREWFEVEASQAGVKAVDEVVRRWVTWADTEADREA